MWLTFDHSYSFRAMESTGLTFTLNERRQWSKQLNLSMTELSLWFQSSNIKYDHQSFEHELLHQMGTGGLWEMLRTVPSAGHYIRGTCQAFTFITLAARRHFMSKAWKGASTVMILKACSGIPQPTVPKTAVDTIVSNFPSPDLRK